MFVFCRFALRLPLSGLIRAERPFKQRIKRQCHNGIKRQLYQVEQNIGARNGDTVEQPLVEKIAKHHCDTARKQRKRAAPKAGKPAFLRGRSIRQAISPIRNFAAKVAGAYTV